MDTRAAETKTPDSLPFLSAKGEHAMLDLPFAIGIDGRQFRGLRLSLVMAEISGLMDPALEKAKRLMRLSFPFNGFSVTLDVLGVVTSVDRDKGTAMVSFVDPGAEHLPQMRHILNSYIAGDLVALGDVLGVGATSPSPASRAASQAGSRTGLARRLLGAGSMLAATVALAALVGTLAYNRFFTQPLATAGQVVHAGMTLDAVTSGQLDYVNLAASKGEVAFTIRSISGEMLSIAMPCDCAASLAGPEQGATVQAGEPVMAVYQGDAPSIVTADVPAADLLDLAFADHVEMRFADGQTLRATVDPASLRPRSGTETALIRFVPDVALPAERTGQLVKLTAVRGLPLGQGGEGGPMTPLERLTSIFSK